MNHVSVDAIEEDTAVVEKEPAVEIDPRALLEREQIEYFREIFTTFDVHNKDVIPAKSIGIVLRMMGLNPTKAQIKAHLQEIDPQNKGVIDFYSFLLPLAQRLEEQPETHEDIIAAFKVLDDDELEYLTTDQLQEYLTTLGEDLEDFEIELLLKMAETKGTGRVYYSEFVEKTMGIARRATKRGRKK